MEPTSNGVKVLSSENMPVHPFCPRRGYKTAQGTSLHFGAGFWAHPSKRPDLVRKTKGPRKITYTRLGHGLGACQIQRRKFTPFFEMNIEVNVPERENLQRSQVAFLQPSMLLSRSQPAPGSQSKNLSFSHFLSLPKYASMAC